MSRLIAGLQPVRELLRARPGSIEVLYVEAGESPQLAALVRFARDQGVTAAAASRGELDRRAAGARHQGAVAIASDLQMTPLEQLTVDEHTLVVALDELQDPQNFGAVVRSAVALGATAVLWPEHASAPLSAATFRAAAGAIEHATLCRVPSLVSALASLRERGVVAVALDSSGDVTLGTVDLKGPIVLVVGSEGKGLRRSVRNACEHVARLPMRGPIASLNASVAAAIALYEVARQRA